MRIITFCVTLCCFLVLVQSVDEHRPKKKEKRQLDYAISQYYAGPHSYHLERRISNGPQHPSHYSPSQYYPGPPRPYRKGRPYSLPAPPYAVQMEPLIHYSQRDPLYNTNTLSPDTDSGQDLTDSNHLTDPIDRGGSGDTIYIPHKPFIKVVEKPVYIKEPEPIIEIIIKESNITLPPPPTEAPPPPQKKKKEEVQVFYVKYKKNPNGYGKDAVIYDKPIPAISPSIPDEPEPEEEWKDQPESGYGGYSNEVTEPPRPSTTLRTIIKPDSEIYHSPGNNVKVTFGKEGFDYEKRSSKPEDFPGPPAPQLHEEQFPRARQLSSFSDVYFKRQSHNFHPASSNEYRTEVRAPQPYRPFNNFPSSSNQHNSRPANREFNNRPPPPFFPPPKYPYQNPPYTKPSNSQAPNYSSQQIQSSRSSFPNFSHSISHPPPPHYQSHSKHSFPSSSHQPSSPRYQPQPQFPEAPPPTQRKPVPYTPFDNIRSSQPTFSQPLPSHQPQQTFNQPPPTQPTVHYQTGAPQLPHVGQNIQFRPETHFNSQQQSTANRPAPSFSEVNNQFKTIEQPKQPLRKINKQQHQNNQQTAQQNFNQFNQQQQAQHQQQQADDQAQYQEHLNNIRTVQKIVPPGGELVHSLPKYEQHLIVNPATGQLSQTLPLQRSPQQQFSSSSQQTQEHLNRAVKSQNDQNSARQYLQHPNPSNEHSSRQQASNSQVYSNHRSVDQNTIRSHQSTTIKPTTTTNEPEKPSTTTKDPKVLEAQLPDEVPDELRQQLLASGILNNADISILDYDKVGDIPLSDLPADQLANFYSAGGAQQLAGSEPVPQIAALTARRDQFSSKDQEMSAEESEISEVAVKPNEGDVEMKVVKYNPESDKGQKVQEAYISDNSKQVDPVVLNDNTYNRYLPLKINGTQFPIPDVPELKGKLISSVVVLAPISYDFSSSRQTREANLGDDIQFIQNGPLKDLLANPTQENYQKFLENEKKTATAKQAVVLLVADGSKDDQESEKEIYMYDIATKTVSKLSGELSSAFVEAAEANSSDTTNSETTPAASNIVESRVPIEYHQQSARDKKSSTSGN